MTFFHIQLSEATTRTMSMQVPHDILQCSTISWSLCGLLNRVNTFTNITYKEDPTIFAWELMNDASMHLW